MSCLGTLAIIFLIFFLLLVGIVFLLGLKRPYATVMGLRNLKRRKKMNLAFICATCVSTIVITGSLIAGDSLRGSITNAAFDNLSEVDEIVNSERLFNGSIVDRLAQNESLMNEVDGLSPLIYLKGIAESPKTGERTGKANIIGFDGSFLDFGEMHSTDGKKVEDMPDVNEVFVSELLANEIGLGIGDKVNISFSRPDQVFEAIFLGNQKSTTLRIQFEVKEVLKAEGLGRFQLNANRKAPQNVYVPLLSLQGILETQNGINTILVSNKGDEREGVKACDEVSRILKDTLDDVINYKDVGLKLIRNTDKGYVKLEAANVFFSYDYYELLSSDTAIDASSPILTYFFNSLSFENRSMPYSTVTAFDSNLDSEFGLFILNGTYQSIEGSLDGDEIILNNWTAERLQVQIDDIVEMNYSVMDEFYNVRYLSKSFTVKYIVDMEGKANDGMLMPSFPGIEGRSNPLDWNPPFPIELGRITEDDEKYWQDFGGIPKAFISLETGNEFWKTDIGNITQVRIIPDISSNLSTLSQIIERILNANIGMSQASISVKNVKLDALNSAQGIELFTEMFLAFSAACIIASAVLIVLLITLRIEYRMTEMGTLRALGFRKSAINQIFLVEGTILSIIGGFIGILLGLLFGIFLINGMNSFWSSIVEGSPVKFYSTLDSLAIGFSSGVIISIFTIMVALHYEGKRTVIGSLKHLQPKKEDKRILFPSLFLFILGAIILTIPVLLGIGFQSEGGLLSIALGPVLLIFSIRGFIIITKRKQIDNFLGLAIVIYTLIIMFYFVDIAPVIELFFVSGFMLLSGFLLIFHHFLTKIEKTPEKGSEIKTLQSDKRWLSTFAVKNAARRPRRTLFTVFLFSLTLFVLVSLTINLQGILYDVEKAEEEGGGGYQIIGESTNPIFANLADENSRISSDIHSQIFDELEIEQFKTKGDVGGTCSNLNREASPRIIGANESFFHNNRFVFISHEDLKGDDDNPWVLLEGVAENGDIPAIGDYNTIVWILGLDLGSAISILDESGQARNIRIVGIIGNSIFQGSLIIWDENFDLLYPTNNGYQLFLFKSQAKEIKPQIASLETALAVYGFDAYSVKSVVIENILIENTYISIFQVLLMFGLIIGTLGFGIVASRNTFERKREIGILRAIGFSKRTVLKSLLLENSYIVLWGIIIGTFSGIIASSVYLIKIHLAVISWPWLYVLAILAISFIIAISSALIPIFRSSKLSVSDAIRTFE